MFPENEEWLVPYSTKPDRVMKYVKKIIGEKRGEELIEDMIFVLHTQEYSYFFQVSMTV